MRYLCMTILALALALPAAAIAANAPNPNSLANTSCKTQQTAMALTGATTFKLAYGTNASRSNAFGKCVAKATLTAAAAVQNAAKSCKAQQADANFAAVTTSNPKGLSFDVFYGGNSQAKGKAADANALGKCVSLLTQQSTNAQTRADVAAAKSCKTELADKATFAHNYGPGKNAFGVCVSRKSKI